MKTIIIKTQQEIDELPSSFEEYTRIEIRATKLIIVRKAWDNSTVEAWDNSTVKALDNSTVKAWDNSSVELFISAYAIILGASVIVKKVLDHATAVFKGRPAEVIEQSETAHVRQIPADINPSFEEWLERGYVHADGITKKLKSQKTIGEIEVFECEDFPKKTTSYVVKKGELFSHGETIAKAIEDLRYKIGDRDTSEFESWKSNLDKEVSFEDAIAAYRVVTGACEFGTKDFVNSTEIPEKLTPNVILELTKGRFGHEKFNSFLAT